MNDRFHLLFLYVILVFPYVKETIALSSQSSSANHEITFNAEKTRDDKKIVCYFQSWSVYSGFDIENDIDPNVCTHIIYAFAKFDDSGAIIEGDPFADRWSLDYSWGKGWYRYITINTICVLMI